MNRSGFDAASFCEKDADHVQALGRWVLQAQVDAAQRPGVTSAEQQRIKDLEREVRDLEEANEILKAASIFFARELDPRHR
jgi:transposase-like protein